MYNWKALLSTSNGNKFLKFLLESLSVFDIYYRMISTDLEFFIS
jgi:hypothetical protein